MTPLPAADGSVAAPQGLAIPPRLLRSVLLQLGLIASVALLVELPWRKAAPVAEPPRKVVRPERRIRVVQLPKPPPLKVATPQPKEPPKPPAPKVEQPKVEQPKIAQPKVEPPKVVQQPKVEPAKIEPPPKEEPPPKLAAQPPKQRPAKPMKVAQAAPSLAPPRPAPAPLEPRQQPVRQVIAADATAVQGVRLRVLVPRDPASLASHLRGSGGCLVVSRLAGGSAEVLSVLSLDGGQRARQASGPPCDGVPRLLRDAALNDALGDPLGAVRASLPANERAGELVLQVLLTPSLHDGAREALQARFGAISEAEMGRRAAAEGYELTCFAEPAGELRCQ